MTPNPLYLETGLYPRLLCTHNTHKYLLAKEGGQTLCNNKQELKFGTLIMSTVLEWMIRCVMGPYDEASQVCKNTRLFLMGDEGSIGGH
jgi:hypothetical protein